MHLKLGFKGFVIVSSADAAKAFLKTNGNTFSSRPKTTAGKYATYNYSDMVDVLLKLAEDPALEVKLQRQSVKAIAQDLLIAGIDTSATTIEWAMSELLKNPEILRKATEELDRVIGRDMWVEEKDIMNLPYIEAVTKESMRLHPAAPILPPRTSTIDGDSRVLGYDIPAGTQVVVNVWAMVRDPAMWDNPNEFYPERFIGKDVDVTGHNFELLPFGAGRMICPGYPLGLKVVQVSLVNLVHGFQWSLPDDINGVDLNMEEIYRLTCARKQPLEAVLKPRLSSHDLYL